VEDNGPGIEAQHRERVFERFYRILAAGKAAADWDCPLSRSCQTPWRRLKLDSGSNGAGTKISLRFPARQSDLGNGSAAVRERSITTSGFFMMPDEASFFINIHILSRQEWAMLCGNRCRSCPDLSLSCVFQISVLFPLIRAWLQNCDSCGIRVSPTLSCAPIPWCHFHRGLRIFLRIDHAGKLPHSSRLAFTLRKPCAPSLWHVQSEQMARTPVRFE